MLLHLKTCIHFTITEKFRFMSTCCFCVRTCQDFWGTYRERIGFG